MPTPPKAPPPKSSGPTAAERGRDILRRRSFVHLDTFVSVSGHEGSWPVGRRLELWGRSGHVVVLHDYGEDGWDLYLGVAPGTTSVAKTIAALDEWMRA